MEQIISAIKDTAEMINPHEASTKMPDTDQKSANI